jgi:hypothetical protein
VREGNGLGMKRERWGRDRWGSVVNDEDGDLQRTLERSLLILPRRWPWLPSW